MMVSIQSQAVSQTNAHRNAKNAPKPQLQMMNAQMNANRLMKHVYLMIHVDDLVRSDLE